MQFDKERRCLVEGGQRIVAIMRNYDSAEWERFLTAAPEIARALLSLLSRPDGCPMCDEGVLRKSSAAHWPECPYLAAHGALQKAGVL